MIQYIVKMLLLFPIIASASFILSRTEQAQAQHSTNLIIGYPARSIGSIQLFIAQEKGFFREEVSDDVLVNTLSTYLECTPLEKQFLLESDGLLQQARRLNDLIQFMLHDQHGARGWD